MSENAKLLLSVREAAQLLDCGTGMVYNLVAEGVLPYVKLGRLIKLPRRGLEAWVERQSAVAGADDGVIELAQRVRDDAKGGQ